MPHHITQRETRRFDVFRDEAGRLDYLTLFRNCREFFLRIIFLIAAPYRACIRSRIRAHCLMTNQAHYIAIPERPDLTRKVFHCVHGTHSRRFNIMYGFVGHLWQERPFSCVLDEPHVWSAIRYVERNPVRAAMVMKAADYRWSSAAAHCSGEADSVFDVSARPSTVGTDWTVCLDGEDDPHAHQFIRDRTAVGRPCG